MSIIALSAGIPAIVVGVATFVMAMLDSERPLDQPSRLDGQAPVLAVAGLAMTFFGALLILAGFLFLTGS